MQIKDKLHGWVVEDVREIHDISATMYLMEHEGCGTKMCYIDRDDECKTFAISFVTHPTDDTGVFHILEHAVLCGSRSFPVKEPFTDLLQTSPNCYLNAMTYPDKTVYPVSSKNAKDFHNLIDVYMDAVLHPRLLECENIFRQEGWRYEVTEEGELDYNGVVYSEMKGVFSSPTELLNLQMARRIYKGGTYSYESGGIPDAITELSYEDFVRAHEKFYHPSGALIYLDGKINLDDTLPQLSGYLSEYERREVRWEPVRGELDTVPFVGEYEIAPDEAAENKTYVGVSYEIDTSADLFAPEDMSLIADALADGNTSPLKSAILAGGLCKNVSISPSTAHTWASLDVTFSEVKDGSEEELLRHFERCALELIEGGIDDELLAASIDLSEFRYRECDFGSTPRGIGMLPQVLSFYYMGMDPALGLNYSEIYENQRKRLGTSHYTDLLRRTICGKKCVVILHPSLDSAEKNEQRLREKLAATKERLGKEGIAALSAACEEFRLWQQTPDSEEARACLPHLGIEDLGEPPREVPTELCHHDGATVIYHEMGTGGITYTDMFFDASDIGEEDIFLLGLMGRVYSELDTALHTANEFAKIGKSILGTLTTGYDVIQNDEGARLMFTLKFSSLDKHRERALELVKEYLYDIVFDNPREIAYKLSQMLHTQLRSIPASGHAFALRRAVARYSTAEVIKEHISGYEAYLRLKECVEGGEEAVLSLIEKMKRLHAKILTRPRLTLSIVGTSVGDVAKKSADIIRGGEGVGEVIKPSLLPKRNEVIPVSSQVGYAVLAASVPTSERREEMGAYVVLSNIFGNLILWDKIRVSGGAYGAGFNLRLRSGSSFYYSYRDPSPTRSIEVYREAPSDLRNMLSETEDISGFIIGAIGMHFMQASTPYLDAQEATRYYMIGYPKGFMSGLWRSIAKTSKEELYDATLVLDEAYKGATWAIVAPKSMVNSAEDYTTLEL